MDIRILRYFLTVAKEQNFTKAAEQLNITQPTLSRQLSALEDEIGKALFIRGNRSVTLTETGMLLKRRALEILDLEEKMMNELMEKEELMEGTITIGCGEFAAVETLAEICKVYKQKYPMVQIALHTATADSVYDMMNQGLVDIGLFMEPVNTEGLDYIRIMDSDHWVVGMKPDDPLAYKEYITKDDLMNKPLILPKRRNVQSRANLPIGLVRILISFILRSSAILERMPVLWQLMDWDIRFQLKALQNIGERICLYIEDCILK